MQLEITFALVIPATCCQPPIYSSKAKGVMRVLISCEYSGVVREAFAKQGHDAWSCDLLPTKIPGQHIQDDVRNVLRHETCSVPKWDIVIAFPPCTHLSSSGAVYWKQKQKDGRQKEAILFFEFFTFLKTPQVCIENPVGIISTVYRKPDQIINPYQFGDPYRKKTCLWLKNLPLLTPTNIVEPIASWHSGSTRGGLKKDGTRTKSKLPALYGGWKKRSLTFQGIAEAMATQWS